MQPANDNDLTLDGCGIAMRIRCHIKTSLVLEDGVNVSCVVADFSTTGALLIVPCSESIPDKFVLLAGSSVSRSVEVVRRDATTLAVRYL